MNTLGSSSIQVPYVCFSIGNFELALRTEKNMFFFKTRLHSLVVGLAVQVKE
jgi:hypothetical protein